MERTNRNESGRGGKILRRDFLKGTALAATGIAGLVGLSSCSDKEEGVDTSKKAFLPDTWDVETDILVVGCGGAGISAAITAHTENLGEVLVLEAAPEGLEGGNTRISAQAIFIPDSVEGAVKYQGNLNKPYIVPDDLMQAWAENIVENYDWLGDIGIKITETESFSPEWPAVEGSEHCRVFYAGEGLGYESLWKELAYVADDLGVVIQHDTRALELIFEPATREVHGVIAEQNGKTLNIKARKGVLLALGGFENNPEMVRDYFQIGYDKVGIVGTPYNRGDGFKMVQQVGAEMWHMNNFANIGVSIKTGGNDEVSTSYAQWKSKDYIFIGADGKRFDYEEAAPVQHHGKYIYNGVSTNKRLPAPMFCIFGKTMFEGECVALPYRCFWNCIHGLLLGDTNQQYLDAGVIVSGETPEELAKKINHDPAVIKETIDSYNANARNNIDPEYNRGQAYYNSFDAAPGKTKEKPDISPFDLLPLEPPYYAIELLTATLNTQGGPKRGTKGEVLDSKGTGIPRLYAAGEFGAIYAYNYNGGGNVSEALSSGRLAARSIGALTSWEEL